MIQSILVSGARNRLVRSVSGCLVRVGFGSNPRCCNFVGELNLTDARGKTFVAKGYDSESFPREDSGGFSRGRSGPEAGPYSTEAMEALAREGEKKAKYLLTIKSEEEMRMLFDRWAAEHGKVYKSDEEKERRFCIFAERLKKINKDNLENPRSASGLNKFSDRMYSEIPFGGLPPDVGRGFQDLGGFSRGRSGPEAGPYSTEAMEALAREGEKKAKYLLTIKSEEEMRMLFDRWAAEHGKVYKSDEEKERRFCIFAERLKKINKDNLENPRSASGLNKFSDRMYSEIPFGGLPPDVGRGFQDLGGFSRGRSGPEAGPYSTEAMEALAREGEKKAKYLLTIKSEEEMRMLFDRWAAEHGKVYKSDEEKERRFCIFAERLKKINKDNLENPRSASGLNKFSDRMYSEIPFGGLPPDVGRGFQDLGGFSRGRSGPEAGPYSTEAMEALAREGEKKAKYLLTIKSEEEMRMLFDRWAAEHGKVYKSDEEKERRFCIFAERLKKINKDNLENPRSASGLNKFSDMMYSEIPFGGLPLDVGRGFQGKRCPVCGA